jgi:hypothetical protein
MTTIWDLGFGVDGTADALVTKIKMDTGLRRYDENSASPLWQKYRKKIDGKS